VPQYFGAAHARHQQVDEDAANLGGMVLRDKFLRRLKITNFIAMWRNNCSKKSQSLGLIIDDENLR
jgi:hypothetical protein